MRSLRHCSRQALALWACGVLSASAQDLPTGGAGSSGGTGSSSTSGGSGAASSFGSPGGSGSSSSSTSSDPFGGAGTPAPSSTTPASGGTGSAPGTGTSTVTPPPPFDPFAPATPSPTTPPASSYFGAPTPAASSFGAPPAGGQGFSSGAAPSPTTGAPFSPTTPAGDPFGASTTGSGRQITEAPPTFSMPGFYGRGGSTFSPGGSGVMVRPKFRYTGSITFGLDDNVFSTPFNAKTIPAVTQEVEVSPAVPPTTTIVTIQPPGRGSFFGERPRQVAVTTPGKEAKFETRVVTPEIKPPKRTVSFIARANVGYEVQFFTRKTVFTMDLNGSASYYTNRPGDATDFNGTLALAYVHRITPRLQFSAGANLAYLSQPDLSRVNTGPNQVGDYFNGSFKMDLSYRWTRRLSTVTSLSINATEYTVAAQQANSFYETILGTEARYLLFPKLTAIGELRYGKVTYPEDDLRDSHSLYLLVGGETQLSRRINASVRFGAQMRTFEASGESKTGPFGETSLGWRYHRAGQLLWTTRFGFEEPPDAATTVQVLRTTIGIVQAFSARLRATGAISIVHTLSDRGDSTDTVNVNSFSIDAGMDYQLSRNMTLTGSYNFIGSLSSVEGTSYIRNQIFFGVRYAF